MPVARVALSGMSLFVLVPALLAAQAPIRQERDSAAAALDVRATSARQIPGQALDELPVDSVEGALLLEPGVTVSDAGLSVRGGAPDDYSTYVNGIDVTLGSRRVRVRLGTNTLSSASLLTGPLPAWAGNSRSGALWLETRRGATGAPARLSYETDRLMGASSLGLNRFEGSFGGATGSTRIFLGGTLTGQKAAEFGAGARDIPIFVPAGADSFSVARGDCDACTGDRTPASGRSGYRLSANIEHDLGTGARLSVLALRARDSDRIFSYRDLFNPANLFAQQTESRVYGATLRGTVGARRDGTYRLSLSRQSDQLIIGPLTPESEIATRDPAAGLMLGGVDFRWDFETFPVDSTLITNYRNNVQGSRRSPYDLANVDQYSLIDRYRGPYGLYGFPEGGGPVGGLTLFREERTVLAGDAAWQLTPSSRFILGGEYASYSLSSYEHQLTSQAGSDVYIGKPVRGALYAEDQFTFGALTVVPGVRYDFFSSRAQRPFVLDTLQTVPGTSTPNPTFGSYQPFPRIGSYTDADGLYTIDGAVLPLAITREDERHAAWSPRFRASLALTEETEIRAGISREARMPDLSLLYTGTNTDLAITNPNTAVFGSDLGFERSWVSEIGIRHRVGSRVSLDLAGFQQATDDRAVITLVSRPDPARANVPLLLRELSGSGRERARGIEASIAHRSRSVTAMLGYGYQDVKLGPEPTPIRASWGRPHTITASVGYRAPDDGASGLLKNASAWIAFRMSSGTSYSSCAAAGAALSDEACQLVLLAGDVNSVRLPTSRQLDLRFTRQFGPGGITAYIDARNLLNVRNTLRVFSATATTSNPAARDREIAMQVDGLRNEAEQNGVLDGSGAVDLTFGGQSASGCDGWTTTQGDPARPSCLALIQAERRFGDGNGIYSVTEQQGAAGARFDALVGTFHDAPRRVRVGLEIGF